MKFKYEIIRIKDSRLNINKEVAKFKLKSSNNQEYLPTIFHVDIAYEVFENVDQYLFNLIVSRYLKHSCGFIWRRKLSDLFLIEISQRNESNHSMLDYFPRIDFQTPVKYLYEIKNRDDEEMIDDSKTELSNNMFQAFYRDEMYQRCCYYLELISRIKANREAKKKSSKIQLILN